MKILIKWELCPHPRQGSDHPEAQGGESLSKGSTNKQSLATTLFFLNGLNTMHLFKSEVTEFLWRALCLFLTRTCISFQITVLSVHLVICFVPYEHTRTSVREKRLSARGSFLYPHHVCLYTDLLTSTFTNLPLFWLPPATASYKLPARIQSQTGLL